MRSWGVLLTFLATLSPTVWGGAIDFGATGVVNPVRQSQAGVSLVFSGGMDGRFTLGGYGGAFLTPSLRLGIGGAEIGINPAPFIGVLGRAGLGGGTYSGQAGATWQLGSEVDLTWADTFVFALTWDSVRNLRSIPALDSAPLSLVGLGFRVHLPTR